ncbi:hypothetical protein [Cupriavidus sp. UYPR2.512]|uniref:hypothetical protein n=1 Tax=Cupriavidus sp. UYPR2.512 TaxID=1080187 RepID=UPI00039B8C01|nr:hypothetical protein [Cupriavidus sp. UYPR2.512]UIF89580.1 hypothetical protein KAF44_37820 [Cupriavidus necator]
MFFQPLRQTAGQFHTIRVWKRYYERMAGICILAWHPGLHGIVAVFWLMVAKPGFA